VIQLQINVLLVKIPAQLVLMLILVLDVIKDMFYKELLVNQIVTMDITLHMEVFVYHVTQDVQFVYQESLVMFVLETISYKEIAVLNNVMMLITQKTVFVLLVKLMDVLNVQAQHVINVYRDNSIYKLKMVLLSVNLNAMMDSIQIPPLFGSVIIV